MYYLCDNLACHVFHFIVHYLVLAGGALFPLFDWQSVER